MQKKIIALAVAAAASGAAFAQTNVTVYGVLDVQQAWVKSSGATTGVNQPAVGRLDAHGNYIGFKGVEDLGNGLKAVFLYETALYADNGGAFSGGRDSYVGLTGGFGTVVAGNLTHPLRAIGAKVELLPGAAGFGTMASVTGTLAGLKTGADDRAANAIAYVSPSFSGVTVTGAYVNGENKNNADVNARALQLAAQYDNGPLFVAAGYHKAYDPTFAAPAGSSSLAAGTYDSAAVIRLAAAYTLPTNTKLTALYDNTKVKDAGDYAKRNAFSLGVAQGFGKNTVGLEYAWSGKIKTDAGSLDNSQIHAYTLVYGYELSKRTSLNARYAVLTNKNNGVFNTNFYNVPVTGNGVGTGANSADYTGFSVGLRHTF